MYTDAEDPAPPPATEVCVPKTCFGCAPSQRDNKLESVTNWFEKNFRRRVRFSALLKVIRTAREDSTGLSCSFQGKPLEGAWNVAIPVRFEDGREWILKLPKRINKTTVMRMGAEVGALRFLDHDFHGGVPAPRLHAYSLEIDNAASSPYIIMDKVFGISLEQALERGMANERVHRTLEDLARIQKLLLQRPFIEAGSLVPFREGYAVDSLISKYSAYLDLEDYRSNCWEDGFEYYYHQCRLGQVLGEERGGVDTREEWEERCNLTAYLYALLPAYVQPKSNTFYLAHTDLGLDNIIVDPSDGTVTGVIDWEFANTLPLQAREHYPLFLTERRIFKSCVGKDPKNADAQLDEYRAHYAKQFEDDPQMSEYLSRIDAVHYFESILRCEEDLTAETLVKAIDGLEAVNGFHRPLPPFVEQLREKVRQSAKTNQLAENLINEHSRSKDDRTGLPTLHVPYKGNRVSLNGAQHAMDTSSESSLVLEDGDITANGDTNPLSDDIHVNGHSYRRDASVQTDGPISSAVHLTFKSEIPLTFCSMDY